MQSANCKVQNESARRQFLLTAAIVAAALIVYLPVMLRGGFFFDDDKFLYANKLIRASDGLWRFWFTTQPTDYFPLTSSLLWVEWRLWGAHAAGYHVVNVLLHAASAVLVWRVLRRLRVPGAWLAGVLFAVHPVAAASAAWITELKNTLSTPLYLLALLAWLRFDECEAQGNAECRVQNAECRMESGSGFARKSNLPRISSGEAGSSFNSALCILHSAFCTSRYLFSLALFLLALFAKSSVVMLPVALLLCAGWRRGKISLKDVARSVPFFALALALGCLTIWFQHHKAIAVEEIVRPEGAASRLAASGWIAWFYLCKILLPVNQCVIYPRWIVSGSSALAFLPLALLAAGMAGFWMRRKSWGRAPLFAMSYFILMLLPVLGFVDMSLMETSLVADHLQYIAMIGVIAFAAGVLARLAGTKGVAAPMGVIAATGCILVLGSLTWARAALYADAHKMWQDNVDRNPAAWLAWNNLGWTFHNAGNDEEAIKDFSRAIELQPNPGPALSNRAGEYAILGKFDLALADSNRAIALMPKVGRLRVLRGNIFFETNRLSEALDDYSEAVRLSPKLPEAYSARARVWLALKDCDKAWADVKMFRSLGGAPDPDFVPALIEASGRNN